MNTGNFAFDAPSLTLLARQVDPTATYLPARIVRRIIRERFEMSSGHRAPHDFFVIASRDELRAHVDPGALGVTQNAFPETALLLPIPENQESAVDARIVLWRTLFHAALDRTLERSGARFPQDRRWFGATMLHEIRNVLEGERRLLPSQDEQVLYREFTALFLELRFFSPQMIPIYFPGFGDPEAVARTLEESYQARTLFESTRPRGTPDPLTVTRHPAPSTITSHEAPRQPPDAATTDRLQKKANQAASKGNDVRAAIFLAQLQDQAGAAEKLRSLVSRLQATLKFSDTEATSWFDALQPVLIHASTHGFWDVGERLLYELQKACLDMERNTYSVDAVEWAVSFGKQPIKRLLDKPRSVNVLRRLRTALKHLQRMVITSQEQLEKLLHHSMHAAEKRVRDENRPILNGVLDEVGIVPENQAERIARGKLVEELLDTLCSRGFLKMSDLRDAIARNRMKLNDLAGPQELILGDPLIRANRKLALRMDGIYRRGEIYMRGLQRLSSLGFGTSIGRLLVLWLILPLVASFVILSGTHEIAHVVGLLIGALAKLFIGAPEHAAEEAHSGSVLTSPYMIVGFALFLLGLIHSAWFRGRVGYWMRFIFLDVPSAIYHSPITRSLVHNAFNRFCVRYLLLPLLMGTAVLLTMRMFEHDWESTLLVSGGAALLAATLFRTPLGRGIEERFDELLGEIWHLVSVNFIIGVLTLFLQFFRWLFEWMERGMYAVDEWLRFQEGQSQATLVFKLIFGIFWFFFTYLFRFAWNLLIEPQINPIKHFPVVTVSHKLILPLAITGDFTNKASPLASLLIGPFDMTVKTANTVASTVVWGIPGIFGFLVWELKENWRLYRANRSPVIRAIPVGSHGERIRGLLRPGFHSGVVPKTFAKLRKAEAAGNHKKAAKLHHHLDHTAEAVQHFVDRDLIAYLKTSQRWGGLPIQLESILLATNRIRIRITQRPGDEAVIIVIEERGGWLIGSIENEGWIPRLDAMPRAAFVDALLNFYKLSGVHVVREQAANVLGIEKERLDCQPEGLILLPSGANQEVTLEYADVSVLTPSGPVDGRVLPAVAKTDLILSDRPLAWQAWVDRWENDLAGKKPQEPLFPGWMVVNTPNGQN